MNLTKTALAILTVCFSLTAFGGEYTAEMKEADDDLCVSVTSLVNTTNALRKERAIEKIGGVKNLETMRVLSEAFARQVREFAEANEAQEKAHGRVKAFAEDCENISRAEEDAMTDEVQKYLKAVKP